MTAPTDQRIRRLALPLALAGCGAAAALAPMASGGSASQPGSQTLRVGLVQATHHILDSPPRAKTRRGDPYISPGDGYVLTQRVLDGSGQRIGTAHLHCVATRGGRTSGRASAQCAATLKLRRGDITAAMAYRGEQDFEAAVTGGTGAYEGASGSISFAERRMGRRLVREARIHLLP